MKYEHWDKNKHETWVYNRLKNLLYTADRHIPYYRTLFKQINFSPNKFQALEDIHKLPFVTKEDILAYGPNAFCDERTPSFLKFSTNTGGTSGSPCPLQGLRPFSSFWSHAFMNQQWQRIGYQVGDPIAILRGRLVSDLSQIYSFDQDKNTLTLSTYDLSKDRVGEYVELLNRFKIKYLHVYPSSLALFLDYFMSISGKMKCDYLQGLLIGSEIFFPEQKIVCEKVLGVPCYHWYGHSEMILMGGWCENDTKFHFFPEYGYLELVSTSGGKVEKFEEVGEIVGTGFCNPGMVLIRYRTKDFASGFEWRRCGCGRDFPTLNKIFGRSQEYIIDKHGAKIPVTAFTAGLHLPIFDYYRKVQIEQIKPGELILRLERYQHLVTNKEKINLSARLLQSALRNLAKVDIIEVDEIPLQANGKHQFVIQHIKNPAYV
jgi:phenylacetate-CoA ligase